MEKLIPIIDSPEEGFNKTISKRGDKESPDI